MPSPRSKRRPTPPDDLTDLVQALDAFEPTKNGLNRFKSWASWWSGERQTPAAHLVRFFKETLNSPDEDWSWVATATARPQDSTRAPRVSPPPIAFRDDAIQDGLNAAFAALAVRLAAESHAGLVHLPLLRVAANRPWGVLEDVLGSVAPKHPAVVAAQTNAVALAGTGMPSSMMTLVRNLNKAPLSPPASFASVPPAPPPVKTPSGWRVWLEIAAAIPHSAARSAHMATMRQTEMTARYIAAAQRAQTHPQDLAEVFHAPGVDAAMETLEAVASPPFEPLLALWRAHRLGTHLDEVLTPPLVRRPNARL